MSESAPKPRRSRLQKLVEIVRRRPASGVERAPGDIESLLGLQGVDYQVLASAAAAAVKIALRPHARSDGRSADWDVPLLHLVLRKALLTEPAIESVLMTTRRDLLLRVVSGGELRERDRRMMVSLAWQAFNNEYVWGAPPEEEWIVGELSRGAGEPALAGSRVVAETVGRAMYQPLWCVGLTAEVVALADAEGWVGFQSLLDLIRDHEEETRIRAALSSRSLDRGEVADAVRDQYEESPYPRWFGITSDEPKSLAQNLIRRLSPWFDAPTALPLRVLVAGSGTGKHPIAVATSYFDVSVTAIDISRSSLSRAILEARKLGVGNLEFVQSDLLRVSELGIEFDVIESVGVLHHLRSPSDGLRALTSVLRPGGVMKIGVYSQRARRRLPRFQARAVAAHNAEGSRGLTRVRREILKGDDEGRDWLLQSWDFFSLSGCRDLLSHAHEVTFTPAGLKAWLSDCGVVFLGYANVSEETAANYRRQFPGDEPMMDLDLWEEYETDHPDTFPSLQVFWARRKE